jgi:plastocyanin
MSEKQGGKRMQRTLLFLLVLTAALLAAGGAGADTRTVQITKSAITPANITVQLGDTVTWRNNDTATHQVVADDGSFASPVLKSGETFSFTFVKNGKVNYRDDFARTHRGSVTVTGSPASVTLNASTSTIVYGESASLSGQTSGQLANEPVTLTSQPTGKGTQSIATTTTSTSGTFTFNVNPTIQTAYQAHWRWATARTSPSTSPRASASAASGRATTSR